MPLSRKDYEAIAAGLKQAETLDHAVEVLAGYFESESTRFDRRRFMEAAKSDDLHFTITLRLGNAALPLAESGGWSTDTLIGVRDTVNRAVQRMLEYDDVVETVLDANGNAVGLARFHH